MVRISFFPVFDSFLTVIILVMVILVLVGLFGLREGNLNVKKRRILLFLRCFCVLLLLFTLIRPAIVYQKKESLPATLVLMIDHSESMSIADEAAGQTRYQVVQSALNRAQSTLAQIEKRCEIQAFTFDRQIQPLKMTSGAIELPLKPAGEETAIGASLQQVLEQTAGKRLLGTLLLSDGTQRTRPPHDLLPQTAASRFRDNGDSIYVVKLGNPAIASAREEIAIQDLIANDRVFVKNELLISGHLRVNGYVNQKIPLALFFETAPGVMSEVARQEILIDGNQTLIPYQFRYIPQLPGEWKLTVSLPEIPGSVLQPNQTGSRFVRVFDHGVNVLYLEGTWRPESKFLRLAIDASPDIQLKYVGRPNQDLSEYFVPGEYAAYILGDIDSSQFRPRDLEALAEAVRQGAGFMMLGGSRSFGAGGYAETPLAALLPVVMNPLERQPLDSPIIDQGIAGPIPMLPTVMGQRYVMRLLPDLAANAQLWRSLPPLNGITRFTRLTPNATVLAESPRKEPILVAQIFGAGRVMAFAGDSTWLWATHGFEQEHKRFWRQTVLWLTKMDETLDSGCWIEMDSRRFFPGEVVRFRIHAQSKTGQEIPSPTATAVLVTPSGEEVPVVLVDENGVMTGSIRQTDLPGDYRIQVSVTLLDPETGETDFMDTSSRFMVVDQNLELENPIASPAVLDHLAILTGGEAVSPENLSTLLNRLMDQSEELVEYHETKKTLYDTWFYFVFFASFLCFEWFLRKRWGQV